MKGEWYSTKVWNFFKTYESFNNFRVVFLQAPDFRKDKSCHKLGPFLWYTYFLASYEIVPRPVNLCPHLPSATGTTDVTLTNTGV